MQKKFFNVCTLLLALGLGSGVAHATEAQVVTGVSTQQADNVCKGVVTEANGDPVIGATVQVKGTKNVAITDIDGNFTLKGLKNGDVVQVSYLGYKTVEVRYNGGNLNVTLSNADETLEEVVVTGYGGKTLRTKLTNSIAKVNSDQLTKGVHSNPAQALSGAVSGLRVVQNSGNPGAAPSIVLRGGTNLDGSGSPLVIVDGMQRSMSDLNPEDIESMEVLKDAGATALYGARASNGVILITTKSGKEGTTQLNVKARVGLSYTNTPHEFCDAGEYLYWIRTAYNNTPWAPKANLTGATPLGTGNNINSAGMQWNVMSYKPEYDYLLNSHGWQKMEDPINPGQYIIYKDTDLVSYNINQPTVTQDYNVNMSGGNSKGSYYAGVGFNKSNAAPKTSFYQRFNVIFNGTYNITKWLKSESKFTFNRANWNTMPGSQTSQANYFGRILSVPRTARYVDEDGNPKLGPNTGDGNQNFQPEKFWRDNQSDKFTMSQSLEATIMKGLTVRGTAIWYYDETVNESMNKDYQTNQAGTAFNKGRSTTAQFDRYFNQTYNAVLNYNTTIAKQHGLNVMLGSEFYSKKNKGFYASGSGAPTDDFADLEYTDSGDGKRDIDSWHSEYRILSYFGRVNYDFQGKYLLSGVFRQDGYSSLIDNRWGFFPGVSAGWLFGNEDFVKNYVPQLSFGKLRMSYGVNGNASGIGSYTLQGSYGNATYAGNTGFLIGTLPNPSLRWEKTKTFELGADVSFFNNRVNANFTFYNRLTEDKYAAFSLPSTTGFSSVTNNNGKFRNRGIELELSGSPIKNKDITWDIKGNISYNKNIIVQLPDNGNDLNRQGGQQIYTGNGDEKIWVGGYQEGQEPGIIVAYVAQGIFQNNDEINAAYPGGKVISGNNNGKTQYTPAAWAQLTDAQRSNGVLLCPGDVKWKDVNGDGIIDSFDQEVQGNTTPHWFGGLTNTVTWKGFTLYAAVDFAFGFKNYDNTTPWYLGCMQGTYNMPTQVRDTWTPENPNAKYPRYIYADFLGPSNMGRNTTMFTYNGAYLAFREIALSYSLPKFLCNKIFAQRVELSVTGQNLGYLTSAPVAMPETSRSGGTASGTGWPLPTSVVFGLNVTF